MAKDNEKKSQLHQKILTRWLTAVSCGDFEQAIRLDFHHYSNLVKSNEDIRYWDRWQKDTHPMRSQLTNRFQRDTPTRISPNQQEYIRFAIVHHNYSGLAHEVQISRNIQFLRRQGYYLDFKVIYLFDSLPEAKRHAANLYQISESNVIFLSAGSYLEAATKLDVACQNILFSTILYPSLFNVAFWMSLFNTHPRQKFLQMKYYPWQAGRIAEWAGGRRRMGDFFSYSGFDFLQLETLDLSVEFSTRSEGSFNASGKTTFGSISRPEKIADPTYNKFIESILRDHTELTYLYAGRPENVHVIPNSIRTMTNVEPLGWVDPTEAIEKFTIYLEPFPWGGGEMSFLALRAGVPYLSLGTKENRRFGLFDFLQQVAASGPDILQYSFCNSVEELRSKILQLTETPNLRKQLGKSWQSHITCWRPSDVDRWVDFLTK
jgi:hypothetical protein